jgi:hypothetical protein
MHWGYVVGERWSTRVRGWGREQPYEKDEEDEKGEAEDAEERRKKKEEEGE